MTEKSQPPYNVIWAIFRKSQIAVLATYLVMVFGSTLIHPEWSLRKTLGISLILPMFIEIIALGMTVWMFLFIWRLTRIIKKHEANSSPQGGRD